MPPKGNAIIASWRPAYVRGYRMRSSCAAAAARGGPCTVCEGGRRSTPRSARPAAATSLRNVRRPVPDLSAHINPFATLPRPARTSGDARALGGAGTKHCIVCASHLPGRFPSTVSTTRRSADGSPSARMFNSSSCVDAGEAPSMPFTCGSCPCATIEAFRNPDGASSDTFRCTMRTLSAAARRAGLGAGGRHLRIVHLKVSDEAESGFLKASMVAPGQEPLVHGMLSASPASTHALLLNIRAEGEPSALQRIVDTQLRKLPGHGRRSRCNASVPRPRDLSIACRRW